MSVPFGPPIAELHKRAADELRRIVRELCAVSTLTNEQIADLMGYKSRNIISIMRNYQYGLPLYPEWALFAFLLAVGVRDVDDVNYVFSVYDFVSGRTAARMDSVVSRPTRTEWWHEQSPTTEEVTLLPVRRYEREHVLSGSS